MVVVMMFVMVLLVIVFVVMIRGVSCAGAQTERGATNQHRTSKQK